MTSRKLGKLCLTIDSISLLSPKQWIHPSSVNNPEKMKDFYNSVVRRSVSKSFSSDSHRLNRTDYSILRYRELLKDFKPETQPEKGPPLEAELQPDVMPFLKLARGPGGDWPFEETVIFGTLPATILLDKAPDHESMRQLFADYGIRVASKGGATQPDPFYLDGITAIFEDYEPPVMGTKNYTSPSVDSIFRNMKLNLKGLRSDHEDFHHLYVTPDTKRPNGAAAAIHAGFPVVRLVRPNGPTARRNEGFIRRLWGEGPEKIHLEPNQVPHIKNLPTITSLLALKEYRPGEFNAVFGEEEEKDK